MRPPEEEIRLLVGEWIKKADMDFKTVVRLGAESARRIVSRIGLAAARYGGRIGGAGARRALREKPELAQTYFELA